MTKPEGRMMSHEDRCIRSKPLDPFSFFVIRSSVFFRHSLFGFRHYKSLQSGRRKVVQSYRADDLQALRTDFIHSIACRVPRRIIKINEVERWNSDGI